MYKKLLILVPLVLLGAGCAGTSSDIAHDMSMPHSSSIAATTTDTMTMPMMMTGGSILAGNRIVLDTSTYAQPGTTTFSFKLYGKDKNELTDQDLRIEHGKKMHFIVVRDDMTQFQHIHPEYTQGKWTVTTVIPEKGQYQIYADIVPEKEEAAVLRVPVTIGGKTVSPQLPTPTANMTTVTDGITAKLTSDTVFTTNQETNLTFVLTKDGQPVTELDPYLGAYGHVVLLRQGSPDSYLHVHPLTETKPLNGQIQFAATFPQTGRYTFYAQFSVAGKVETFTITVDVLKEGAASSGSMDHMMMHH
jgi:hypothetical protein